MSSRLDAVVVGSGPNGLAAALTLAEAGCRVKVYEAAAAPGGGCRTSELTLPGFRHDVCASVAALTQVAPFFRGVDLTGLGVRVLQPEIPFAHPLDAGPAALAWRDLNRTADGLGRDGPAWRSLFGPLIQNHESILDEILGDLRRVPRHPMALARLGLPGLLPASGLARIRFRDEPARALFAGLAAHSMRRLDAPLTAAFGLVLGLVAHVAGWPVIEGGIGRLTDALVDRLEELDVEIVCNRRIGNLAELPASSVVLLDVSTRDLLAIAGPRLAPRYRRALTRFRYGPGVFKVDYALSQPVPWRDRDCRLAGTVHLGGTLAEVAGSEAAVEAGQHSQAPYVLVVQPGVVDPTRAPGRKHTLWAYCHVPNGSTLDRTAAIERQIERFAPGFRDIVAGRANRSAAEYEVYDANYVGGDINSGRAGLFGSVLGPVPAWSRYNTSVPGVYLCSSATAPGGGVHGMCGMNAARQALRRELAGSSRSANRRSHR